MLELSKIKSKIPLTMENIESPNLTGKLDQEDLQTLGEWCSAGYARDKQSRSKWERRTEAAMDLAMQIQKEKSFPWPNCSNVTFPLVTIATMQFHARAYPAIIPGPDIVQYRVLSDDPEGQQRQRANRIGRHMSWQLMEEDKDWEEQMDKLLINVPVVGCAFKKTYRKFADGYNESELVLARDLVLNYRAKSVETCPRKTHIIRLYRNDIYERVMSGQWRNILEEEWYKGNATIPDNDANRQEQDNRTGEEPSDQDEDTPFTFGEMHCLADLDKDGYKEPYIITFELENKCVVRIVCGCDQESDIDRVDGKKDGKIVRVRKFEQFTKYAFIPSPDGGIYDMGFGVLLGPINEAVNTNINQLVDAGTMATTAGGFLGRGAKIRGGNYMFSPFSWNRVDSSGEDLHKSIYPLPVREPSDVLFKLLMMLVEYANRIAGSTDMMVGESPGQNTPAETSRTVTEMGGKIFSAIFKRIWRSAKQEYEKLYVLNGLHLPVKTPFGPDGDSILREDYLGDPSQIAPVADPHILSDSAKLQQAMFLKQSAMSSPGYDHEAVERRVLTSMHIQGISEVYPGPKSPKATQLPNPKVSLEQIKIQGKMQLAQLQLQSQQQQFVMGLMEEQKLNNAKIIELQAKAVRELAEAKGIKEGHTIALIEAQLGVLKSHNDVLAQHIDMAIKSMEAQDNAADRAAERGESAPANGGGMGGLGGAPGNGMAAPMGGGAAELPAGPMGAG